MSKTKAELEDQVAELTEALEVAKNASSTELLTAANQQIAELETALEAAQELNDIEIAELKTELEAAEADNDAEIPEHGSNEKLSKRGRQARLQDENC